MTTTSSYSNNSQYFNKLEINKNVLIYATNDYPNKSHTYFNRTNNSPNKSTLRNNLFE